MPSSFTNLQVHVIFGTRQRTNWIKADVQSRLYEYMGGTVRGHKCTLHTIGGMPDHVHLLIRLHPDVALSALVRELKSESTSWMKRTFGTRTPSGWQRGYGAFSVSHSQSETIQNYIQGQEQHHQKRDFRNEFEALLKMHNVEYNEAYIWE